MISRIFLLCSLILFKSLLACCQTDWIAPEGKIINDRTLNWADFLGKPGKGEEQYAAATQPAIYFVSDKIEELSADSLSIKLKVKCAFQSASWVREGLDKDKDFCDYGLNHEQEHYDIALTCAYKLQYELSARNYSQKNYQAELDSIYYPIYRKYLKTQEDYDRESDHSLIKAQQNLWDMRIKKCLENYTTDYYSSPQSMVETVTYMAQTMKRMPNEPARQFAVRCRPMYSEYNDELNTKLVEFKEWTDNKAVIAFYTQKYKIEGADDAPPKEGKRLLAYAFMPYSEVNYKRVLIDTFCIDDKPPKITGVFFANADSDQTKELIITTSCPVKNDQRAGILYKTYVYAHTLTKTFPARLRKLADITAKVDGGVEGVEGGKPSKAKFKTEKEIRDELKRLGY